MSYPFSPARFLWLAMLIFPGVAAGADAWWNDDWAYRKQIDIDTSSTGLQISETQTEFPVLVRLHLGNFQFFSDVKPDGSDIRFIASDDLTPLNFHIEKFDPTAQIALLWVQLPQLTAGVATDFIYMYYGNADAVPGAQPGRTFDKNYASVLHFGDEQPFRDVTAYGNHPQTSMSTTEAAGLIGPAVRLEAGDYLRFGASPSMVFLPEKGWTFSSWVKLEQSQAETSLVRLAEEAGPAVALGFVNDRVFVSYRAGEPVSASGGELRREAASPLTVGSWHHLALQLQRSGATLLVDGAVALRLDAPLQQINGTLTVGDQGSGSAPVGVLLDELRVSNSYRSVGWLGLSARSQQMNSFLLAFGEDSQRDDSGSESYFVTTLRNVDWGGLEGVVIAICVVMAMVTWYVMAAKGMAVARIRRANADFSEDFAGSSSLEGLRKQLGDGTRSSTLFQLFDLGMAEIDKRVSRGSVGAASARFVSREGMEAIRAILAGRNVRISQRLNNLMVLLTLAIAGGPFLGLLGTVVGVMVTFAGIAASGDVNISAIAPGIAAALVATVAGLFVAIPALFGYNYITTRIKEIITENNVFLEEFLASVAETYQE